MNHRSEGASELSQMGQAVFSFEGRVEFFIRTVLNYPTLVECYETAALDGINRPRESVSESPAVDPRSGQVSLLE